MLQKYEYKTKKTGVDKWHIAQKLEGIKKTVLCLCVLIWHVDVYTVVYTCVYVSYRTIICNLPNSQ